MTIISFQDRIASRRIDRAAAQERLENIKADRALVAVTPAPAAFRDEAPVHERARPSAFLAQLVATRDHAPQTRARNRAEPAEAVAAYRNMMEISRVAARLQGRNL